MCVCVHLRYSPNREAFYARYTINVLYIFLLAARTGINLVHNNKYVVIIMISVARSFLIHLLYLRKQEIIIIVVRV